MKIIKKQFVERLETDNHKQGAVVTYGSHTAS